jgi:hypothetical protein
MDFFPHPVAQCGIYQLMALNQALAGERFRYDDRIEMLAIAIDFKMGTVKAGGNIVFNEFRGGQHDFCLLQ